MSAYRLLISELIKQLGWHFPILVVWTALVGLGEGTSIVLFLPLLDRVGIVAQSAQGVANAVIQKGLALVGADSTLEILMLIVVAATTQMILSVALSWWSSRLARNLPSATPTGTVRRLHARQMVVPGGSQSRRNGERDYDRK